MMLEILIFFVVYTVWLAVIEIFYWEQEIKKKVQWFSAKTYWKIHPIPLITALFLLTWNTFPSNLLLIASLVLLYTVLEDVAYFWICQKLGSGTTYQNQDWMDRFDQTDIPLYYLINSILGIMLLLLWLALVM